MSESAIMIDDDGCLLVDEEGCLLTGTCVGTHRQARVCGTGVLADVWMTEADAATLTGAFALDALGVPCFYFDLEDPLGLPGTIYAAGDANSFADCAECSADNEDPCADGCCQFFYVYTLHFTDTWSITDGILTLEDGSAGLIGSGWNCASPNSTLTRDLGDWTLDDTAFNGIVLESNVSTPCPPLFTPDESPAWDVVSHTTYDVADLLPIASICFGVDDAAPPEGIDVLLCTGIVDGAVSKIYLGTGIAAIDRDPGIPTWDSTLTRIGSSGNFVFGTPIFGAAPPCYILQDDGTYFLVSRGITFQTSTLYMGYDGPANVNWSTFNNHWYSNMGLIESSSATTYVPRRIPLGTADAPISLGEAP